MIELVTAEMLHPIVEKMIKDFDRNICAYPACRPEREKFLAHELNLTLAPIVEAREQAAAKEMQECCAKAVRSKVVHGDQYGTWSAECEHADYHVYAIQSIPQPTAALDRTIAEASAKAIEFAVKWTMKQMSQRSDWPLSWDAGFPSYKAGALIAFRAGLTALAAEKGDGK